ncbi:MAG: hypothetical protein JSR91_26755, partial [Proteobacteria bacterium]|nr:hypothetical protein [Pseudomonadota bacterium]
LYAEVDPGRGLLVDPQQLRDALGDEAANRILNTPGIMPMAKPTDEEPLLGTDGIPDSDGDLETPKDTTPLPPALPKPKGIPDDWIAKPSDKKGGMQYVNPKNNQDRVRVMPAEPDSPHETQQRPYVVDQTRGSFVDKNGKPIRGEQPGKSPEAHIPYEEYIFRR